MPDTQVGTFIDETEAATTGAPKLDPASPKVPFQTALKLTGEQEKRMLDWAFKRMKDISTEMGREVSMSPNWWTNTITAPSALMASQGFISNQTFMQKRARFDATYFNDMTYRPYTMGNDNIFMHSNMSVPLSRRICRQMIAKAKNAFIGGDPWVSISPQPSPSDEIDDKLAEKVQTFCRFKLDEAKSKDDKGRAIERALVLGECPVFTSYVVRDQLFDVESMVMTDVNGAPHTAEDGNTISPDDAWEDAQDGLGTQVLSRDKKTLMPDVMIPQKKTMARRQVLFEGARSEPIYYKDFLCPLTAASVQEADCVVHLYDKPVMSFVDMIVKRGMVTDTADDRMAAAQRMLELVKTMADNSSTPKAAVNSDMRPGENFSALPLGKGNDGPVSEFANFFIWFDANEDGIAENIMLVADRKNQAPIFYDHVANVTTDGLRPIEIVRINPVEGRWYGQGIIELFEPYQTQVDLMYNRWNFSQSSSGRTDFWDRSATLEGDANPNLEMNRGRAYSLKPGKKAEDALSCVYLNDIKFEQIYKMLQFPMQLAMNESGVSNANDAQAAGMDSGELATGIINIQQTGDELFKPTIADLTGPLSNIIDREVSVILANMNDEEAVELLKGDTAEIETLTPDDVRGLKFKVKVELTAHKNQQIIQTSAQVIALIEKFYLLNPMIQPHVAAEYRRQIRALDPKCDADAAIVVQPPMPPPMPGDGGKAPVAGQERLGDSGAGGSTPFEMQLTQANNPKVA